ncbi:transmembrane protein 69-like [Salarias fasciatus]|uniref:Transmembrane protein 69-like n=1 Tax=Salarias fasciatus TaxID=181472 RepID=A0A672IB11_SALFA|nr:transmembrane protein 69-like [Salarias fasciatus]XP_029942547.1 transmembrane protein 69-like [Salarias fasciatus]
MFSFTLRRSSFATHKLLHWSCPPQRLWTSTLNVSSHSGAFSSYRLPSSETACGHVNSSSLLGFRTELFRKVQTNSVSHWIRNECFHSSAVRLKKRAKPEPPPRELDLLRYDLKNIWESPKPALYLGFAGLIPFVGPSLFMAVTENYYPELAYAQLAYAASIVSFLGGARWGFALPESSPASPDWINLANSVVPSLLACMTMLISDNITPAIIMVIMGLGISLHYDLALLPTYPSWFKALRSVLTVVATFSLVGTLLLSGSFPEKKLFGA